MIVKNKYATYVANDFAGKFRVHAQRWYQPDAASANSVLSATTLASGATTTVTTGIVNPDFPRVLSITGAMAGGSLTGNVVINGTDIRGNVIQDTVALSNNATVNGVKAFKTVTSIVLPARVTSGDTVSIGISDKLGAEMIPYIAVAISAHHGATLEGTLPTITVGATIDLCLVDFNSACGADHDQHVVYYTADQPSRSYRTS